MKYFLFVSVGIAALILAYWAMVLIFKLWTLAGALVL